MPPPTPQILLTNANLLTLHSAQHRPNAIAISGSKITWVGSTHSISPAALSRSKVIHCGGKTILPGFIDAHCHILAYAASLLAVDCTPAAAPSITHIIHAIKQSAAITPHGEWIRAAGYDHLNLAEKRHPTSADLDLAAPDHPVILKHRSGHACVLNSIALQRVGITAATDDPPGATIARNLDTAAPNGLLLEMDTFLDKRIPRIPHAQLTNGVALASQRFLANGITSVQDATPSNSIDRLNTLRQFAQSGTFTPAITAMVGIHHINHFADNGLLPTNPTQPPTPTIAHAKIVLTQSGGSLYPSPDHLHDLIASAHNCGFPVAIHAVEADAVHAAALALQAKHTPGMRDRIEHASECPPSTLSTLISARPIIVTQPAFIHHSGDTYLSEFRHRQAQYLYPLRAFTENHIPLAASSDAPVSHPNPLLAIHAAATRRTRSGKHLAENQRITPTQALAMHTTAAAYAAYQETHTGSIVPGKTADLAILTADPTTIHPDRIPQITITTTITAGKITTHI